MGLAELSILESYYISVIEFNINGSPYLTRFSTYKISITYAKANDHY